MNARSEKPSAQTAAPASAKGSIRVWDPIVRLFHWTVVAGCAVNLLRDDGDDLHRWIGYIVAAAITVRLLWGVLGRGHARFSTFMPRPAALRGYLGQLLRGREPRYVGHNPAGAVMMAALVGLLIAVSLSGWMLTLDRYWGNEMLQEVHGWFAEAIVPLAAAHVLAAIVESVRHRENLIKAMITGRKPRAAGTDIDNAPDPD